MSTKNAINLSKVSEKHNKKTAKMFEVIGKNTSDNMIKAYEYKCKVSDSISNDSNVLEYPTELLLGLKELKNNSFDISNIYSEDRISIRKGTEEPQKVKTFCVEGYTGRITPEDLKVTTITDKNTAKIEKAVEKQINNAFKGIEKACKKGTDLTNYTIIKEPIDTSLTHAEDVLSYPLVPLLTLSNLCKSGVKITNRYIENIAGQDYLIINADINGLI